MRPLRGVGNHLNGAGVVVGQLRGPAKRDFSAPRLGHLSDFVIIRGDDDTVEEFALASGLDLPGDHGLAAERFDVFAVDAFAAAAGGNDGDDHSHNVIESNGMSNGLPHAAYLLLLK